MLQPRLLPANPHQDEKQQPRPEVHVHLHSAADGALPFGLAFGGEEMALDPEVLLAV